MWFATLSLVGCATTGDVDSAETIGNAAGRAVTGILHLPIINDVVESADAAAGKVKTGIDGLLDRRARGRLEERLWRVCADRPCNTRCRELFDELELVVPHCPASSDDPPGGQGGAAPSGPRGAAAGTPAADQAGRPAAGGATPQSTATPETPDRASSTAPRTDPLAASVRGHEGLRLEPYRDSGGVWHICYGRRLSYTEDECEELLAEDLAVAETEARRVVGAEAWTQIGPVRRDALSEAAYATSLHTFRDLLAAARQGEWDTAADELVDSLWARTLNEEGSERPQTLAARLRSGER